MNYRMVVHIIGYMLKMEAILLVVPALVCIYYKENILPAYIATIVIVLTASMGASMVQAKKKEIYAREGLVVVALSWIMLSFFGALPFYFSGAIPKFVDCFFETVSGFTTTGASILNNIEALPKSILFWRSFTHWVGGMGVLVFVLTVIPLAEERSMHLMRAEVPGPVVGKIVPRVKTTAKLLYGIYIFFTVLEMIFLFSGGMPLYDSVLHAFSTAGTGGFSSMNASIASYNNAYFDYVISVFMILFGINFNLFYFLLIKDFTSVFKNEELKCYFGIIIFATIVITLNIYHIYGTVSESFRYAFFQVSSVITTTGFMTADFSLWPELSKAILLLLMFVGASAGSTGGAMKVSRVIILIKNIKKEMKHTMHPRSVGIVTMDGEEVKEEVINGVNIFFIIYMFIIFLSFFLVAFEDYDFTTTLTAVITCIGNVGPGFGMVGPVENFSFFSGFSKIVLSIDMLLGRLEIFPVIMLFSPYVWKKSFM